MIGKVLLAASVLGGSALLYNRRQKRLFQQENAARKRLGLPQLTPEEFGMRVEEKSVEYRGKINQHM